MKTIFCGLSLLFLATVAQASQLEDRLARAERLAELTNAFAQRCENDLTLEKRADTEDCDNFLSTHALWSEADEAFQQRYRESDQTADREWKEANHYRLAAYKHQLNRTKRSALRIMEMIRKIP